MEEIVAAALGKVTGGSLKLNVVRNQCHVIATRPGYILDSAAASMLIEGRVIQPTRIYQDDLLYTPVSDEAARALANA